jgi:hypothetical protein
MKLSVEPKWRDTYHDNVGIAFMTGLVTACVASIFLIPVVEEWALSLAVVFFLLVTFGVYKLLSFREPALYRFFLVDLPVAMRVVKHVLFDAGILFTQEKNSYILDGDSLIIEVHWDRYGRRGPWGSVIRLRPCTPDQKPLINTLRAKIDEAFLPKGM